MGISGLEALAIVFTIALSLSVVYDMFHEL